MVTISQTERLVRPEHHPASYVVYKRGNLYYAKALLDGGTDYEDPDAATVIQNAANALGVRSILFKNATYSLTNALTGLGSYLNAGVEIPSGITLIGEDRKNTKFTTGAIPAGDNNGYFACFVNKNRSTENSHITIANLGFDLPSPTETATGLKAWDSAIWLQGAHDCTIRDCWINNGAIQTFPNTAQINTPTALTLGNNYGNHIENCLIENMTNSSEIRQGTNSWFINNRINKAWDDPFLIASAGIGNKIIGNIIDATEVVTNKGALTAGIFVNNDGAVGSGGEFLRDNLVENNTIQNVKDHNTGGRHGIAVLAGKNTILKDNHIHDCAGSGISVENCNNTTIETNKIFLNKERGIFISASIAGTFYILKILNNTIYNNGTLASIDSAVNLAPSLSGRNLQDIDIIGNTMYDDQGTQTQLYAIRLNLDGNVSNLFLQGNNVIRSPNFIAQGGAGAVTMRQKDNYGYNPQPTDTITAGASPWTYTNTRGFDETLVLTTAGGVSAITYRGTAGYPITTFAFPFDLAPGETIVVTWATTAPVFTRYPR